MKKQRTDIKHVTSLLEAVRNGDFSDGEETRRILSEAVSIIDRHVEHVDRDKNKWKGLRSEAYYESAVAWLSSHQRTSALRDIIVAIETVQCVVEISMAMKIRITYGRCLLDLGMFSEAFLAFKSLWLELDSKAGRGHVGAIAANIATAEFGLGHFEESQEWFRKATSAYEAHKQADMQALCQRGIGMTYSKMGKYREAFDCYEAALNLLDDIQPNPVNAILSITESRGVDYLNLADNTHQQGLYKKALACFNTCLELAEKHNQPTASIVANRNIGLVYAEPRFSQHDSKKAQQFLQTSLVQAKSVGIRVLMGQIQRDLSLVQEQQGQYRAALQSLREWVQIDRELKNSDAAQQIANLEVIVATHRLERELKDVHQQLDDMTNQAEKYNSNLTDLSFTLGQKNAEIDHAIKELTRVLDGSDEKTSRLILQQLVSALERSHNKESYWQDLEVRLEQVHSGALNTLAKKHPDLNSVERRVCLLIHHGLSNKDMAELLSVQPRSIEKYRQRIRRKLGLNQSDALSTYLAAIL